MNQDLAPPVRQCESASRRIRARLEDDSKRRSFEEALGTASLLTHSGQFEDALSCLRSHMDDMESIEAALRGTAARLWALSLYGSARITELQDFATKVRSLVDAEAYASVLLKLAWARLRFADESGCDGLMEKARKIWDRNRSHRILAELKYLEGYLAMSRTGNLSAADKSLGLACSLFRLQDEKFYLAQALLARSVVHWGLGHPGYAETLAEEALEIAAALGNYRTTSIALRQLGIYKYRTGDFPESARLLGQVRYLHTSHEVDVTPEFLRSELARARLQSFLEKPENTLEILASIETHLPKMDATALALWHEYHGIAHFRRLDYMAALDSYEHARQQLQKAGVETYELAEVDWHEGEVHLALHDPRAALRLADDALEGIRKCGNNREYGQILRVKASALAMLAQPEQAIPLFEEAIAELRRRNNQYELGLTLTKLAETLDNDAPRAAEAANEAIAIFTRIGLPHLVSDALHARDVARLRIQALQRAEERTRIAYTKGLIIAESSQMKELLEDCRLVARSSAAVVVSGETGVGKEVVARYIHEQSKQAEGPFVAINCAALPESLFERELFGHKKGAFTGAVRDSIGLVTSASGGTLFFDEIGELPLPLQAKLLRLLQDGSYRRVGDVTEYQADIRILAATNRKLEELVEEGKFREDLWYRLNAFDLRIPPLRERTEDIAPLTDLFLEKESENEGIEFWMDKQARQLFERYGWPGNVRELESAVRAGITRAIEHGCVRIEHLPRAMRNWNGRKSPAILSLEKHLEVEERRIILHTLRRCNNSRVDAARYLGIGRNTLYEKMQRLGITIDKEASA